MSAPEGNWRLDQLVVTDLLGFQGTKEFAFQGGLQVLEAPNHSGKTSLTMALLWGLTGVVPNLARLNRQSFRLTNKHGGENANPSASIVLLQDNGKRLSIHRAYRVRPDLEADLAVEIDDKTLAGQQAQEVIWAELGLKPQSLEGCGVVLQDHRLALITGKESDISDVINDLLGLYTLSQLVPALEEASKDAGELRKEIHHFLEAADPVAKWEERNQQLQEDFRGLENKAIDAGFSRESLEEPGASAFSELASVAQALDICEAEKKQKVPGEIERLRKALGSKRKATAVSGELATLELRKKELGQWGKTARTLLGNFTKHDQKLLAESIKGEMVLSSLNAAIAEKEAKTEQNARRRQELQEEQGFLSACYNHLLAHPEGETCPLCASPFEAKELLPKVKSRMEGQIASELEQLKQQDKLLAEQKTAAVKRQQLVNALQEEHQKLLQSLVGLGEQISKVGSCWTVPLESEPLFLGPALRRQLISELDQFIGKLGTEEQAVNADFLAKQEAHAKLETEVFQPAESRINRVSDLLVPIIDAADKIEGHGKLRHQAEERQSSLNQVLEETTKLAGQLKRIGSALSKHEEDSAAAAVKAQLPQISDWFRQIAGNPDYDGLAIQTCVSRDKITYKIQATSSLLGNLNDVVGHVLSEGDLSSAGMALILGLTAGQSHRMGFLMLDDPAQGMDDTLQANLAAALARLDHKKQVIILTHQRSFAEALKRAGAAHRKFGGWKLGKIQDE